MTKPQALTDEEFENIKIDRANKIPMLKAQIDRLIATVEYWKANCETNNAELGQIVEELKGRLRTEEVLHKQAFIEPLTDDEFQQKKAEAERMRGIADDADVYRWIATVEALQKENVTLKEEVRSKWQSVWRDVRGG